MACCIKSLHKSRHLFMCTLLPLAFLLVSSNFSPVQILAYGRQLPEFSDASQMQRRDRDINININNNEVKMIGSRPPRCDGKCKSCGNCVAVQVPIVTPSSGSNSGIKFVKKKIVVVYYFNSRGDDISNYKPMCWKCKCGDFIFNP
ncbi:hypothetical protein ACJIZ3_019470 [Penstemon smallii]|uniref:Epidermal patterning factor-like protein n=1 Tax=Penstemon smallii TaxID=265156 RepID=A0ABD3T2H3_9LAMI